jgi:phosphoenolpyruvate carboxykinase (ATP)
MPKAAKKRRQETATRNGQSKRRTNSREAAAPSGQAEAKVVETGVRNGAYGVDKFGFKNLAGVHWNLDTVLVEHAIRNGEGTLVQGGAFCAETGVHTGRSPKDKHVVVDALTEHTVWWGGKPKTQPSEFSAPL